MTETHEQTLSELMTSLPALLQEQEPAFHAEQVSSPVETTAEPGCPAPETAAENVPAAVPPDEAPESATVPVERNGAAEAPAGAESPQVRAGREGARRVHELIARGRLYEQEHGLTRGRQRLRQLLELGKVYEEEHGLRQARRKRRPRLSNEQVLRRFVDVLARMVRPSFRPHLTRLLETLDARPE